MRFKSSGCWLFNFLCRLRQVQIVIASWLRCWVHPGSSSWWRGRQIVCDPWKDSFVLFKIGNRLSWTLFKIQVVAHVTLWTIYPLPFSVVLYNNIYPIYLASLLQPTINKRAIDYYFNYSIVFHFNVLAELSRFCSK